MTKADPQQARKQSIQRCILSLVHACQCGDANCRLQSCQKMKRVVQHTKNCKRKANGGCPICIQLIALSCYHGKDCQEANCSVPFCPNIKHKLKQQHLKQRIQQAQLLRRRMTGMTTRAVASTKSLPTGGVALIQGAPIVAAIGAGGSSAQNAVPSLVSNSVGVTSSYNPGIGMKPGLQTPSPNVLQVVKQVQEEAALEQVPSNDAFGKVRNPQEAHNQSIQRCILSLVHACQCRDINCRLPSCQKMKRVVQHTKNCKQKANRGCLICKQLIALCCYHGKHCQEANCSVPFCPNIKHKLKQKQLKQRLQQAQLLRRRMTRMTTRTVASTKSFLTGGVPSIQGAPIVAAIGAGGLSAQNSVPSLVSNAVGVTSSHNAGIGKRPGLQTSSPNVLQVVKQVQEEAALEQVPSNDAFGKVPNPQEARKQSIQCSIQFLIHACQCRDVNCRLPSCQKMKRVVQHTKNCKQKANLGCLICKQLIALCCYHGKHCQEANCSVPFCPNIKHKLKQKQLKQRLQQAQLLRRRMTGMPTRAVASTKSFLTGGVPSIQDAPVVITIGAGGMSTQTTVPSPVSNSMGMNIE